MWVVFWGTQTTPRTRGVAVELCPSCASPQKHWLTEYYSATHLYWMDIGRATHVGTQLICCACGTARETDSRWYPHLVPANVAGALSVGECGADTNPRLLRMLAGLESIGGARYDSADDDALRIQSRARLEALLFSGHDIGLLLERLCRWACLSELERTELAAEITGFWQGVGAPTKPEPIMPPTPTTAPPSRLSRALNEHPRLVIGTIAVIAVTATVAAFAHKVGAF